MPPTGGYRTSLSWQARYGPLGQSVTDAVFSPGQPLSPPDPEPVRLWDFPVGVNTVITPRSSESFGFAHLRAFANVELVRLAIETRKDQLDALRWRFNPRDDVPTPSDAPARIQRLTQFWRRPDGVHAFAPWLRLAVEDLLAIDAPAFEKRRDRAGRLIGLDVVPGDTIKLLVDETGRAPVPPAPAYQQVIKGRVWADLTTDELLYAPRNRRPNHVLGFSPVEQIVVTIQTIINRQAAQLAYFTEGNAPLGFLSAPEGWGPSQIRELQLWLNTQLSGQASERAKLIWTPAGAHYQSLKDPPLKDDFAWIALAGVVATIVVNAGAYLIAWGVMKGTVAALTARVALLEGQMRALDELKLDVARLETRLDALIEHVRDLAASIRWMREPSGRRSARSPT